MVVFRGKCQRCGKDYKCYLKPGKNSRFCSQQCTISLENRGISTCESCGKKFEWYRAKKKTPRFCSGECRGKAVYQWRSRRGFSWKEKSDEEIEKMMKICFLDRIEKTESCWIWTGSKTNRGYGIFTITGKVMSAHRLAWKIHKGEIPNGLIIRHLCNNPICVNPDHLALGTFQDNSDDRVKAGNTQKGSKNNLAKLNESQVIEIKKLLKQGISGAEVGRRFGVTRSGINSIKNNITWKHVNPHEEPNV